MLRINKTATFRSVLYTLSGVNIELIIHYIQEAQLSQSDRATRYVSWNLVSCCATLQKSHL